MSRYRASLIHLCISAVLVGNVIGIVYWIWYPEPTLEVVGAFPIIRLLALVDLVIGPLLTMIIYVHGKPGLKFDLTVIALLQVSALIYGAYRLYDEKPDYLVFAVDRLEFIPSKQIDQSAIRFDGSGMTRFARLSQVFARLPDDPEEHQRYFNSIMNGQPDLERRAEYWEPWASGADAIRDRIKPIDEIKPTSTKESENIKEAIENYGDLHPNLGVLPIGGIERDLGMLIDRDTLDLLDVLNANPWMSEES